MGRSVGEGAGRSSPDTEDVIFGHLPSGLFGILGSQARRGYSRLLLAVYREFFGENYASAIRKDDLIAFIELQLAKLSDVLEDLAIEAPTVDVTQNPNRAYQRLKKSGWLVEYKRGYVPMVDLDANVSAVLDALSSIEEGQAVHFGGTIAAIESVIEGLAEDPFDKAPSLADSAQRSRQFQQHLAAIVGNLRAHEQKILANPEPKRIIENFFLFVEDVLIADYRSIKTTNNPLRHRAKILARINSYEDNPELMDGVARGYVAQGLAPNEDVAIQQVRLHLEQVKRVFLAAEERLEDIDLFRNRLEQRISRTILYMKSVDSSVKSRIADQIRRLVDLGLDWEDPISLPSNLSEPVRTLGPDNLARPSVRRTYAIPTVLEDEPYDPAMAAYERAQTSYLLKLSVTPAKILAYIDRNLAARDSLEGEEFEVADTEEALLLQSVRQINMLGNRDISERYRVVYSADHRVENQWSKFGSFRVERINPKFEGCAHVL